MSAGRSARRGIDGGLHVRAAPSMLRARSNWMEMRVRAQRVDRGHLVDAGDLAQPPLERGRDTAPPWSRGRRRAGWP